MKVVEERALFAMVGMFEDSTQPKECGFTAVSRRAACIWRRDAQGKFYRTLLRKLSASFMNNPG
jgi:hypothetical protein